MRSSEKNNRRKIVRKWRGNKCVKKSSTKEISKSKWSNFKRKKRRPSSRSKSTMKSKRNKRKNNGVEISNLRKN